MEIELLETFIILFKVDVAFLVIFIFGIVMERDLSKYKPYDVIAGFSFLGIIVITFVLFVLLFFIF